MPRCVGQDFQSLVLCGISRTVLLLWNAGGEIRARYEKRSKCMSCAEIVSDVRYNKTSNYFCVPEFRGPGRSAIVFRRVERKSGGRIGKTDGRAERSFGADGHWILQGGNARRCRLTSH